MKISKRTSYIDISGIRRMFELAKGEGIINLGLGEPDFPIPDESKKAIITALKDNMTHYTPGKGLIELRERIVRKLNDYSINADPEEVIVTSGASEALEIALLTLLDDGDEVLIPDPGFVSYAPLTRIAGGVPVPFKVLEDDAFKINPDTIREKITSRTKAIIINSPGNPTGAVSEKKEIEEIAEIAEENEINVISDEVYSEIVYKGKHHSIGQYTNLAITINGFSKNFAMTGLRLGYVHAQQELIEEMLKIHQYIQASTCSLSQAAAIAALDAGPEFTDQMVRVLKKRRALIIGLLCDIDRVKCQTPDGAFYVFPNFSAYGNASKLSVDILQEAKVIVTPGTAFGKNGQGYLRFSYSTSEDNIQNGIKKVKEYIDKI